MWSLLFRLNVRQSVRETGLDDMGAMDISMASTRTANDHGAGTCDTNRICLESPRGVQTSSVRLWLRHIVRRRVTEIICRRVSRVRDILQSCKKAEPYDVTFYASSVDVSAV